MGRNFRVFGKIQEAITKKGISGLIVEVFDKDTCFDDLLGTVETDTNGYFEVKFYTSDLKRNI